MRLRVVVLSRKSLFADGVVSQLQMHPEHVEVEPVDAGSPGALEQFRALAPPIALVDAHDTDVVQRIGITQLLELSPNTKVFQLDPNSDDIRIYGVASRRASGIGELLEVMRAEGAPRKGGPPEEKSKSNPAPHLSAQGE